MEGYLGSIAIFGGNFAPLGWALCQGQLISIATNTALFSIVGTTFGGNGQVTFGLPDFRGRVPMGEGQGPGLAPVSLGQTLGQETQTLTVANIPSHTHTTSVSVKASGNNPNSESPAGNIYAVQGSNIYAAPGTANGALAGATMTVNPSSGSNQPFNLMQPVTCLTFIICTQGFFPARN